MQPVRPRPDAKMPQDNDISCCSKLLCVNDPLPSSVGGCTYCQLAAVIKNEQGPFAGLTTAVNQPGVVIHTASLLAAGDQDLLASSCAGASAGQPLFSSPAAAAGPGRVSLCSAASDSLDSYSASQVCIPSCAVYSMLSLISHSSGLLQPVDHINEQEWSPAAPW